MIRMSSLRQLAKVWHKAAATNSAEEGAALKGILESGDFKIDLDERTASLCGHELQLTSEEFDVLIFLAGHRQHVVSPNTILATNSAENRRQQTEFLRALISLRKKLDAAEPGKHYLRTEPWVLYRFSPTSSSCAA